jgi:hypothetical protein
VVPPIETPFLEREHVHELIGIYLNEHAVVPEWAIDVVERATQQTAALLLLTHQVESRWFQFISDQQHALLSLLNHHLTALSATPQSPQTSNPIVSPPDSHSSQARFTPTGQSGSLSTSSGSKESHKPTLAEKGEGFIVSLLAQIRKNGPDFTEARGKSEWRVAIFTPTEEGHHLRVKWHDALSGEAVARNQPYIGPDAALRRATMGIAGKVYVDLKPFACPSDVTHHEDYVDFYEGTRDPNTIPYTSTAQLPIFLPHRDSPNRPYKFGVLCFDSPSYPFVKHDCDLLKPLADLCALCIQATQVPYSFK